VKTYLVYDNKGNQLFEIPKTEEFFAGVTYTEKDKGIWEIYRGRKSVLIRAGTMGAAEKKAKAKYGPKVSVEYTEV